MTKRRTAALITYCGLSLLWVTSPPAVASTDDVQFTVLDAQEGLAPSPSLGVLVTQSGAAGTSIELRRGEDGQLLFRRNVADNHLVQTMEGGPARVVIAEVTGTDRPLADGTASEHVLTITAAGLRGEVVWQVVREGTANTTSVGVQESSVADFIGVFNRPRGNAVLITTTTAVLPRISVGSTGSYVLTAEALSGGTGAATTLSTTAADGDSRPVARAVPDLNRDGNDDYVLSFTSSGRGIVEAHDGATGTVLWKHHLANANGVGIALPRSATGMLVVQPAAEATSTGIVELLHPASGHLLWQRRGDDALVQPASPATVLSGTGVSGISDAGTSRWKVRLRLEDGMHLERAGDVDADGARDVLVASSASVVLSGRDGSLLYRGAGRPLAQDVDGVEGADLVIEGDGFVDLVGTGGLRKWRAKLGIGRWTLADRPVLRTASGKRHALVWSGTRAVVIGGSDGRITWRSEGGRGAGQGRNPGGDGDVPASQPKSPHELPATGLLTWLASGGLVVILLAAVADRFGTQRVRDQWPNDCEAGGRVRTSV